MAEYVQLIQLAPIPSPEIMWVWPAIADLIDLACARSNGRFTPADVQLLLCNRELQLWTAVKDDKIIALALSEILQLTTMKVCRVIALVGHEHGDWVAMSQPVETWAKANGCTLMELVARPGWERVFNKYGYNKTHVTLEKRL